MIPEWVLRWVALSLLAFITFIFLVLGAAVLSGLTNELFLGFLNMTWPPAETVTEFEVDSRRELSFSILNYGITALGTAWVASFCLSRCHEEPAEAGRAATEPGASETDHRNWMNRFSGSWIPKQWSILTATATCSASGW
jgi:hypothetical protein